MTAPLGAALRALAVKRGQARSQRQVEAERRGLVNWLANKTTIAAPEGAGAGGQLPPRGSSGTCAGDGVPRPERFPAKSHEDALDRQMPIAQEQSQVYPDPPGLVDLRAVRPSWTATPQDVAAKRRALGLPPSGARLRAGGLSAPASIVRRLLRALSGRRSQFRRGSGAVR